MTRDRIMKAPKLELILTAGVGSDHIDLHAAADKGITVAEVSAYCQKYPFLPAHCQVTSIDHARRSCSSSHVERLDR